MERREFTVRTSGRGLMDLTQRITAAVAESGVLQGLCNVFLPHTSASLLLGENWDPSVRRDLETFMGRLVRDGDPAYQHDTEGPDDMPAHIRTALTQSTVVLPVADGKPTLGTWQGLYLWEHRTAPHDRRVIVTVW